LPWRHHLAVIGGAFYARITQEFGLVYLNAQKGKMIGEHFFFEKKKQKTLIRCRGYTAKA
jgi:hypothetical protein